MPRFQTIHRASAYLWTAPNSLLGALAGAAMCCTGGAVRTVNGVLEFHGGWLGHKLAALPPSWQFDALTLGHVILGVNAKELDALRAHEQVHVRQYERWGVFFLPAYAASSLWQWLCGRCPYRQNHFERQAYAHAH